MYQNLRTTYGGNFSYMVQLTGMTDEICDNSNIWRHYVEVEHPTVSNLTVCLDNFQKHGLPSMFI